MRVIANRQLYTFILNVEDSIYAKVRAAFDALVAATTFHRPQHRRRPARQGRPTGGFSASTSSRSTCPKAGRRSWLPARSPSSSPMDRPTASGPTILLVLAHPHKTADLHELAKLLPTSCAAKSPSCEVHLVPGRRARQGPGPRDRGPHPARARFR